jgi:hypothetical protein
MLQAMGLGGWMFDGITPMSVLGASGDPEMPGLGFRYDTDERWPLPNVTGLPGVFEGFCPPHYKDMRAAVEAFVKRKFGEGGAFNPNTPGPYRENARVRGAGGGVQMSRSRRAIHLHAAQSGHPPQASRWLAPFGRPISHREWNAGRLGFRARRESGGFAPAIFRIL